MNQSSFEEAVSVFCDKYCRYPLECKSQDELDEHCDKCDFINLINLQQAVYSRLKAENKNCGVTIQNQREQLKACNEKIKRLEVDNEKLRRLEFQVDALNEAYEESIKEAIKEFVAKAEEKAQNAQTWTGIEPVVTVSDLKKLLKNGVSR